MTLANPQFANYAAQPGDFDWKKIYDGAKWLHITGVTVSCDFNFRGKLWKYGKSVPEVMTELDTTKYEALSESAAEQYRSRRAVPNQT